MQRVRARDLREFSPCGPSRIPISIIYNIIVKEALDAEAAARGPTKSSHLSSRSGRPGFRQSDLRLNR